MDFVIKLPMFTNYKDETYNLILMIFNQLIKMGNSKPVTITIDIPGIVEVIIDIVIRYHGLPNLIISD